jgi:hypothetical protein
MTTVYRCEVTRDAECGELNYSDVEATFFKREDALEWLHSKFEEDGFIETFWRYMERPEHQWEIWDEAPELMAEFLKKRYPDVPDRVTSWDQYDAIVGITDDNCHEPDWVFYEFFLENQEEFHKHVNLYGDQCYVWEDTVN